MKTVTLTVGWIFFISLMVAMMGSYAHTSQMFSKRYWASYKPGDCLRTPVLDSDKVERWELKTEPDTILMVSEVGNSQYRTREWGRRFSNNLQWYTSYDAHEFSYLDRTENWQPIPCPEQGPDPEGQPSREPGAFTNRAFFGTEDRTNTITTAGKLHGSRSTCFTTTDFNGNPVAVQCR